MELGGEHIHGSEYCTSDGISKFVLEGNYY